MTDLAPRRLLIATGTTRHPFRSDLEDRPELAGEIDRITRLFTLPRRSLGYTSASGFTPDMRGMELKDWIRDVVTSRKFGPDDHLVFYYTGHGEIDDSGEFIFPLADTTDDLVGTGLSAGELARWLLVGSRVQRLLIILDTCFAGSAGMEIATRAAESLGRLRGLAKQPHFAILTATRPREQALSGTFTQAFERAVAHRASGGHEPRYLPLDAVTDMINADPTKAPAQHAQLLSAGETTADFLPNPRFNEWLLGLDLRTQLDYEQRRERDREFADHVLPRAQGLDQPQEGVWLFTGRHAALRDLSIWLDDTMRDTSSRVVTGDPGSGKSALLARLTMLATPEHQRKIPRIDELPPETIPPRNGVDVFIHARGRTSEQVLAGLCAAADVEPGRPGELLAELADRARPLVAVIDALDEATDPVQLTERVLAPLLRGAPRTQLRLILGTRRHLLERLGGPVETLDLDSEHYADPLSVQAYVRRCLVDLVPGSPFESAPEDIVDAVAGAVGTAAGRSFLVALITGRSLALRAGIPNPYDAQWRGALPRIAADAMRLDLDQRLGDQATKARDLLTPLAYALGRGLPWEDIWAPMASALAGANYTIADLDWLVREAGFYVVETLEKSRSVYRLYHEALAEHLREKRNDEETHERIVAFWTARTPVIAGKPSWSQAHLYARQHLATHATAAGVFDQLILDPAYLLHADRAALLEALPTIHGVEATAAALAYRRTIKHMRDKHPAERWAYLELAAHCARAGKLASRIAAEAPESQWRAKWAQWVRQSRNFVIRAHEQRVTSVVAGTAYDHPVVISASDDGTIQAWDLATGSPANPPVQTGQGAILALALGLRDGRPILVSGGTDMSVRIWDYDTGRPLGKPLVGHQHHVRALAVATIDDRPVLVTGSFDDTIRVWDLATWQPIGDPIRTHGGNIALVAIVGAGWQPLIIAGTTDGTVRAWDLNSGSAHVRRWNRDRMSILAMDVAESDDGPTIVISSADETIAAFDFRTGELSGDPVSIRYNPAWAIAASFVGGQLIAVSGHNDRTIRSWNLTTKTELKAPFEGHESSIHAVAIGHLDGQPLAISGGDDGTIRTHDLGETGVDATSLTAHLRGTRCVTIGRLGQRPVAISGSDDRAIRVWDLETGHAVMEPLLGHTSKVTALAAKGNLLVSGSQDGSILVWDLETGQLRREHPFNHGHAVRAVACVVVRGQPAVVSGGSNGSIMVWDLDTGGRMTSTLSGYLYPVVVAAIGQAAGRVEVLDGVTSDGRELLLWGPLNGALTAKRGSLGMAQESFSALFAVIDGRPVIATGEDDGRFRLWDVGDGRRKTLSMRRNTRLRLIHERTGPGPITALAHHPARGFAIAYKHQIDIERRDGTSLVVHPDAEVRTMTFADENLLVVGTTQGIVTLRVSSG